MPIGRHCVRVAAGGRRCAQVEVVVVKLCSGATVVSTHGIDGLTVSEKSEGA